MKHKELITNSIIALILVSLSVITMCFTPLGGFGSRKHKTIFLK